MKASIDEMCVMPLTALGNSANDVVPFNVIGVIGLNVGSKAI